MNFVIIIPARGGSTRIKNKNIRPLNGRPLLTHTIDNLKAGQLLAQTYVSTNDNQIALIASENGAQIITRPDDLANSTASTESALLHALEELSKKDIHPEWVMTLPPTSPFRSIDSIRDVLSMSNTCDADTDCIMSVTVNKGDFWKLKDNGFSRLFPDAPRRQQDREPLYEENSAIYMTRVSALIATQSILGAKVEPYFMDALEAVDINDPLDFDIAEAISKSRSRT